MKIAQALLKRNRNRGIKPWQHWGQHKDIFFPLENGVITRYRFVPFGWTGCERESASESFSFAVFVGEDELIDWKYVNNKFAVQ